MSAILFFDTLSIQITLMLVCILLVRRPPAIFWPWLLLVCIGAVIWSLAETVTEYYVADPVANSLWVLALYTGLLLLIAGWVPFVLSFATYVRLPFRYDTKSFRVFLIIAPCILWAFVITNHFHELFITPVMSGRNVYGPLWYIMSGYSYICLFGSAVLLSSLLLRLEKRRYKVQTAIVLTGSVVPFALNIIYLAKISPVEVDLTIVGMAFSGTMFVSAIYRYRLFALSPFTFHRLLESEIDPYLVLDSKGKVVAYSKVAESFFGDALYFEVDGVKLVHDSYDVVGKGDRRDEFSIHSITQSKLMEFEAKDWCEDERRYFSISTNMVENGHDRVLGIGVRFRDITPLVQRTELIQQQAAILDGVLEATNDAILVATEKGQVYYRNKAMKELWPYDESLSMKDATIASRKFIDESLSNSHHFKRRIRELYVSDEIELNHRVDWVDGRSMVRFSRPFSTYSTGSTPGKGRIWVYHDITSHLQKELEKSALHNRTKDAERLDSLGIMAGGVATDFNNLLTVIAVRVNHILETIEPQSVFIEDIREIRAAGNRAIGLTSQILSYEDALTKVRNF
jgi:PAS domain-containing protein